MNTIDLTEVLLEPQIKIEVGELACDFFEGAEEIGSSDMGFCMRSICANLNFPDLEEFSAGQRQMLMYMIRVGLNKNNQ